MANTADPYAICDPYGRKLYAAPSEHPGKFRFRGRLPRDIKQAIAPQDWNEIVEISAKLCARNPALRGAIRQKSEWAFAGDSWQPIYYGKHEAWGDIATDWLTHVIFPNAIRCNARKDLIKGMQVSAMGWDTHGDDLALFSLGANRLPQITIIPGTRIGNGPSSNDGNPGGWMSAVSGGSYSLGSYSLSGVGVCVGGKYDGYRIYNGIILDSEDEPIAARVLGLKRDDDGKWVETWADFDLGFASGAHLASEYEWHGMGRPLPRVAASILHWMHKEQVDQNLLKAVDLSAKRAVIHKLPPGMDAVEARGDGAQQIDVTDVNGNAQTIYVDTTQAGDVTYISSAENLEGLKFENPHPNVEDFAKRILSECLTDLGWPYELTDLSSTGRAPTRMSCELVNNSLWQKQCTGETRLLWFVKYAISTGIQNGHIPPPPSGGFDEPYKWTFGWPKEMSVDQGNDTKAALDMLRFGLTSQRITSAKWGYVQKRIRRDRQKENFELVDDADALVKYAGAKGHELPFLKAVEFFYMPSANSTSIPNQTPAPDTKTPATPAPANPKDEKKPAARIINIRKSENANATQYTIDE